MSENTNQNEHTHSIEHEPKGDRIHFITANLEHLMDIFEICMRSSLRSDL